MNIIGFSVSCLVSVSMPFFFPVWLCRTEACGGVLPNASAGEAVGCSCFSAEPAGGDDAEPRVVVASGDSPEPVLPQVLEGSAAANGCVAFCITGIVQAHSSGRFIWLRLPGRWR